MRAEILPGIWLDSRLALWLAAERILVIADLHWGYTASHRARGNLLPWWGDDDIEQRLHALIATYQPAEMIWLGDVVHAAEGGARAETFLRNAPLPITLIAGNHDRRWRRAVENFVVRGNYFFHHGHSADLCGASVGRTPNRTPATTASARQPCLEIVGHHHPAVSWSDAAGTRLKLPALIVGAPPRQAQGRRRLVLPAFSPWAVGTRWVSDRDEEETHWAIAPTRIFAVQRHSAQASASSR